MKILILNGPNINLLGKRNPEVYGNDDMNAINLSLEKKFAHHTLEFLQSNHEGELIDALQESSQSCDGIVINAGGFTHSSVAIRDAIAAIDTPVIELHISNISNRESFRHTSLLSPVCRGCVFGMGVKGYNVAIKALETLV